MTAFKCVLKELMYHRGCEQTGTMIAPCKIAFDENNLLRWTLSFEIGAEGIVFENIDFVVNFPSNYPISPPTIVAVNPDYRWVKFCLDTEWSPAARMISIIPHIYASITDPDYYENTGRFARAPLSSPPPPSSPSVIDG